MPSVLRAAASVVLALVGIGLSVLAVAVLPASPWALAAPLASHLVHLSCAFIAGCALLALPRAAPREVLDLVVAATALGLGFLALVDLVLGVFLPGPVLWALPWLADVIAFAVGRKQLRLVWERIVRARTELGMSVVVAGRVPLYTLVAVLGVPFLVAPFMPATRDTGADALALVMQAELRDNLPQALSALPGEVASPTAALLLHGQIASGPVGARLFSLTFVALLAAGLFLHGRRHLGPRGGPWSAALLLAMPGALLLSAGDAASAFLALFAFLAFHEVSDWCEKPIGGKIALASTYAGLALAQGARGLTLLAALLAFLFLVQALVDRHGILRQVPGLAGMALIAGLVAVPFVALEAHAAGGSVLARVLARFGQGASLGGPSASSPALAGPAPLSAEITSLGLETLLPAARPLLEVGPLLLGLVLLFPLVSGATATVRQSLIGLTLAGLAFVAPRPFGTGLGVFGPLVTCAAAVPLVVAGRGRPWRPAILALLLVACPASLLLALHLGPDVFTGARVMTGRLAPAQHLAAVLPDAELVAAVAARPEEEEQGALLLVGDLTTCHYHRIVTRVPPAELLAGMAAGPALRRAGIALVAIDRASPEARELAPFLEQLLSLGVFGATGRHELLAVPAVSADPR